MSAWVSAAKPGPKAVESEGGSASACLQDCSGYSTLC